MFIVGNQHIDYAVIHILIQGGLGKFCALAEQYHVRGMFRHDVGDVSLVDVPDHRASIGERRSADESPRKTKLCYRFFRNGATGHQIFAVHFSAQQDYAALDAFLLDFFSKQACHRDEVGDKNDVLARKQRVGKLLRTTTAIQRNNVSILN